MSDYFARRGAAYINELKRSCGALVGIAQGLLCDRKLLDEEIVFLDAWLTQNDAIAYEMARRRLASACASGLS